MKDKQLEEVQATDLSATKKLESNQRSFDKATDKISDKAASQTVKPITNLVSFGDAGAACQFVDGKIICD